MKTNLSSLLSAFYLLITVKFLVLCVLGSVIFVLLASALVNTQNVISIVSTPFPLDVKVKLLFYILFGIFTALSPVGGVLLIITAVLFGLNISIIISKLEIMKKQGKLGLIFGAGLISLVSAGCAACGISLLSVVGLGSIVAFLPFHGIEFYIISIVVLLWCLYVNLGAYAKACKL